MPKTKTLRPPLPCSNPECDETVAPRRPSVTGDHWCQGRACQAMKARQHYAARKAGGETVVAVEDERLLLATRALHGPRRHCQKCGLVDAVPGFLHRSGPGSKTPCDGVGGLGRAAGPQWLDVIHPELANAAPEPGTLGS